MDARGGAASRQQKFTGARGLLIVHRRDLFPAVLYPGRVSSGDVRGLSYDLIAFRKVIGPYKLGALRGT